MNSPGGNFCQKCGAHLGADSEQGDQTTITYKVGETGELQPVDVEEVAANGGALVIRSGGGRAGESFSIEGERMTIGRSPDAGVFLDDVTVSRRHVEFRRGADGSFTVADVGSLNGTYVNRERIDQVALNNGDEVQIGKYRLVFYASQRGY